MAPDSFWTFLGLVLLVASHVTGQDPCGAAVDSCVGIFDEDLKRAGANDSLVCSASDRLLGCVGSYLGSPSSTCDVIRAIQIVQGITNLAASQVKPNCTLGNARLPVLRTDNCSQTINFCAGFLYAAQTQETAADACTFIGYLQQCSQQEPGFANCTQDKLDAMQDYVSSATFRFNDYPTFCADRDRFDVDGANFKFSQCLDLTRNLTNGLPRDEMCRLYTSLVACQNDAKAPASPTQQQSFDRQMERIFLDLQGRPSYCEADNPCTEEFRQCNASLVQTDLQEPCDLLSIYDDCLSNVAPICENTYSLATYDLTATTVVSLVIDVYRNFNCSAGINVTGSSPTPATTTTTAPTTTLSTTTSTTTRTTTTASTSTPSTTSTTTITSTTPRTTPTTTSTTTTTTTPTTTSTTRTTPTTSTTTPTTTSRTTTTPTTTTTTPTTTSTTTTTPTTTTTTPTTTSRTTTIPTTTTTTTTTPTTTTPTTTSTTTTTSTSTTTPTTTSTTRTTPTTSTTTPTTTTTTTTTPTTTTPATTSSTTTPTTTTTTPTTTSTTTTTSATTTTTTPTTTSTTTTRTTTSLTTTTPPTTTTTTPTTVATTSLAAMIPSTSTTEATTSTTYTPVKSSTTSSSTAASASSPEAEATTATSLTAMIPSTSTTEATTRTTTPVRSSTASSSTATSASSREAEATTATRTVRPAVDYRNKLLFSRIYGSSINWAERTSHCLLLLSSSLVVALTLRA